MEEDVYDCERATASAANSPFECMRSSNESIFVKMSPRESSMCSKSYNVCLITRKEEARIKRT